MEDSLTRFDNLVWLLIKDHKRARDFLCELLPKQIAENLRSWSTT